MENIPLPIQVKSAFSPYLVALGQISAALTT